MNSVPMEPVLEEGNDEIFISIPSYRDGERCGKTIKNLFDNAKDPSKVFVGIIEQNKNEGSPEQEDVECLVSYCTLQNPNINKEEIKKKFQASDQVKTKCPYWDQIRFLGVYHIAAKGPAYARSFARKLIANEEYCMQIDAHSDFILHWDQVAKEEWANINNEYGVLSNIPANVNNKIKDESLEDRIVPQMCVLGALDTNIPYYVAEKQKIATNLDKPLLSYAWSAAFSFAKCHLEENVPYDNFAPVLFDAEQFPRYARMFTRGYDVYLPTRSIVYHQYGQYPSNIDPMEWTSGWTEPEHDRAESQQRIKTLLQLFGANGENKALQANFGLFGLGRRRTLKQLEDFVGFQLSASHTVNRYEINDPSHCDELQWVPYDISIPPHENLYEEADDLDPQPEFPLRTILSLKKQPSITSQDAALNKIIGDVTNELEPTTTDGNLANNSSSTSLDGDDILWIIPLWIVGLFVWYRLYGIKTFGWRIVSRKRSLFGKNNIKEV